MAQSSSVCDFGWKAPQFILPSTKGLEVSLENAKGETGTLIMFICNQCPYVIGTLDDIVMEASALQKIGVNVFAICSNDAEEYPQDSFENMKIFARENNFIFPYLIDESQEVAKNYGAVCTPDFFGYNTNNELQYRGRLRQLKDLKPVINSKNELLEAMIEISKTGDGPKEQYPSMGCNIKWK